MAAQSKFLQLSTPHDLDIISDLRFTPTQNHLLASTWDNRVLLYDCSDVSQSIPYTTLQSLSEVLRIAFTDGHHGAFVGGLDGSIREIDFENMSIGSQNLSCLDDAVNHGINNLCKTPGQPNSLIASSFNGILQGVDVRIRKSIYSRKLNSKIYRMDTTDNYVVMTLKSNTVEIYDLRDLDNAVETRDTGLVYQIQDLKCLPQGGGFGASTIDGRVSMEYFDPSPEVQATKRFTFKCHRSFDKITQTDLVYPVNSIHFNKISPTLFTAGADGNLCLWDYNRRKRMKIYPTFKDPNTNNAESIVKIDLNHDDTLAAVATSDDSYRSFKSMQGLSSEREPSKLYIRQFNHNELMPK